MALIVEDGTGKSDAESYNSVAELDAYHASRGNTAWADYDDAEQKEPAARRATDYMIATYRGKWKGVLVHTTQALDWPRYTVYPDPSFIYALPSDSVPAEVKRAHAELTLRAVTANLLEDVSPALVLSESVGPISVTYANTGQRSIRYAAVDRTLGPLLRDYGSSIQGTARLG